MRFECEFCNKLLQADDALCGKRIPCPHCKTHPHVPESRLSPSALIDDFIIRGRLSQGTASSRLLKAFQISHQRPVILKILKEELLNDAEHVKDFLREAKTMSKLSHAHIVTAYEFGREYDLIYYAMEYIEGKTLREMINQQQRLGVREAKTIGLHIARALDYLWSRHRMVHRNIKPRNIMIGTTGLVKLNDFCEARTVSQMKRETSPGSVTPGYVSPEQIKGQPLDVRSDIYSLGITLYHAVTGQRPFDGETAEEIIDKHLTQPFPSAREINPTLPEEFCGILQKMTAKDPRNRHLNSKELTIELAALKIPKFELE